jgi:hypothetical protein
MAIAMLATLSLVRAPEHSRGGRSPQAYPTGDALPSWSPTRGWGLLGAGDEARPCGGRAPQRYFAYAAIIAPLRHGAPPPVDPDDAVTVLEIIGSAAVCRRARDRRPSIRRTLD